MEILTDVVLKFARKLAWREYAKRQRSYFVRGKRQQVAILGDQRMCAAVARQLQKHYVVGIVAGRQFGNVM